MNNTIKNSGLILVPVIVLLVSGCAAFVTVNERAMSVDDVILITKSKVDSEVIISQIDATRSKFQLTADDIIRLKNEGVEDDVIQYMIESDFAPERFPRDYGYSQSDYWFNYYNSYNFPYSSPTYRYGASPYNTYRSPYYNQSYYYPYTYYTGWRLGLSSPGVSSYRYNGPLYGRYPSYGNEMYRRDRSSGYRPGNSYQQQYNRRQR